MRPDFLDWPFFEDRHRALHGELGPFIKDTLGTIDTDGDERATCARLVAALGEGGWLKHVVGRFDVRSLCLIRETLSHHHGLADFAFAMQGLGSAPISLFGSDALQDRYLGDTASGKQIAAFALSEPDAGSDVGAISTSATLDQDTYVLNGTKTWISNGGLADYYVVFARSESEATGTKGLSAFVVDKDTAGLRIAEEIEVVAPHPLAKLAFEDCRVPRAQMVGEPDETVPRVESRRQFGQKLADFQLTQARLADMLTAIDATALLVYRAAWTKDQGAERVTKESAMAKMYATEAAQRVVDDAVQLFGAEGVVKGSVVERLYREVRALRIYEGTTEIQKLILARHIRQEYENA